MLILSSPEAHADQVLHVVRRLVDDDIGLGEVSSLRPEPGLQFIDEIEIEVDGGVARAVWGPIAEVAPPHPDGVDPVVEITRVRPEKGLVDLSCRCSSGDVVGLDGRSLVLVPDLAGRLA